MAYDIGPKIGIDGEAEFRKQLNHVNTSIKTLGMEMEAVTASFIGQENSMEALTAQNEVLGKKAKELETRLEMQKKMVEASTEAYDEADEHTIKWQQTVYKTTAELAKTNAEIEKNNAKLRENGDAVQQSQSGLERLKEAFSSAQSEMTNIVSSTAAALKNLPTSALDALKNLPSAGVDALANIAAGGVESVTNAVKNGVEKVKNLPSAALDTLKNLPSMALGALKGMVSAGVDALKSLASASLEALKGLASAAVDAAKGAASAIVDFAKASIQAGASFDSAMSQVAAVSGATGKDFDDLRAKAMEMGDSTKFSATESAEAFNYMAMAGWKTQDMISGIEGIMSLAAASGEDLASTSDIVTDALTAFGLSASDSGHFANVLAVAASNANTDVGMMGATFKYVAPVAGALGYSVDDAAMAIGLMANSGIKATNAGTALRSIVTRLSTDAGASSKSLGALGTLTQKLGVQFYDAEGNARDLSDVINESREAWSGLSAEQQISYAKTIAGQEAMSGWLALMNAAPADVEKLTAAIKDSEGAAAAMAATMEDNLAGDITKFQSAMEGAQIALSDKLTPYLREFVQFGTQGVRDLADAFRDGGLSGAIDALGGIISNGVAQLIEELPAFAELGVQLVGSLGTGIAANLPVIADSAEQLINMLVTGLSEGLPEVLGKAQEILGSITGGITSALPEITKTAASIIKTLLSGVTTALPELVKSAVTIVSSLAGGIGEQLPELVPVAIEAVLTLVSSLVSNAGQLVDAAISLLEGLAGGLVNSIPIIAQKAPEIVMGLVDAIVENVPKILKAAADLLGELADGIVDNLPLLKDAGEQIVGKIAQGIDDLAGKLTEIGGNMLDGIVNGMKEQVAKVGKKLKEIGGDIVDKFKEVLGIKSPSTVFRDEIGVNIGLGVAQGIQNSSDKAVKEADTMAKNVYKASKDWLDKNTKYLNLSLTEQIEVWETIQSQFTESSKQWADAQEEIWDLQQKIQKENADDIVTSTKNMIKAQNLSLSEQLALWEKAQSQLVEGSKQWATAQDQIWALQKKLQQEQNSSMEDQTRAIEQRAQAISKIYGLFDQVSTKEAVSGSQLLANLQGQINSLESFYKGVAELSGRGVSDALIEEIRAMGPKAASELNALLSMSDAQLEKYTKLYDQKNRLAADQAAAELTQLKDETNEKMVETMDELSQLFDREAPPLGTSLAEGLANGIRDGTSGVVNSVVSMATAAIEAARDTLGIASPSKVFAGIGEFMAAGLGKGWDNEIAAVRRDIEKGLDFNGLAPNMDMPGITMGIDRPNYQEMLAGVVNGMQTATAGTQLPQSATIVLQAPDGTTVARWMLPDLRAAMRDDPVPA